ncbi:hypothetical protein HEK616_63090 [Streptomyces nigrescens]|uniref:Uncharacterized protein n=1 Tax=Streptomyces nigrescens TaxID=1920 RepID=A0ABN6R550_STRNI|nr:hypothetical protein HEK616_63090 [Streptomyces nigrescens]
MDPRSEILKNRSKPFFGGCGAGFSRVSTGVVAEGDMRDLSRTGLGRRRGPRARNTYRSITIRIRLDESTIQNSQIQKGSV